MTWKTHRMRNRTHWSQTFVVEISQWLIKACSSSNHMAKRGNNYNKSVIISIVPLSLTLNWQGDCERRKSSRNVGPLDSVLWLADLAACHFGYSSSCHGLLDTENLWLSDVMTLFFTPEPRANIAENKAITMMRGKSPLSKQITMRPWF